MISATWWTNSTIYILAYSQYWFQHAALNLITKSSEFILLEYYTTLSNLITSFFIIFDICYMMNQQYYIYSRIIPVFISTCCIEFNSKSSEFTLLQYSTKLSSIIASFCITFDNCYMMNQQYIYILVYSQYWYQHAVINLGTTRREFTLLEYSTTLSSLITSFYIIIWYLLHYEPTVLYIFQKLPVLISTCCVEFNH